MSSLDYVDIPAGATRLRSTPKPNSNEKPRPTTSDLRVAPKVFTSLPNPSSSPPSTGHARQSSLSFAASSLTSPTLSFIPQLLLSSAIPGGVPTAEDAPDTSTPATSNPRQSMYPEKYTLLSTRDPLSLPIMSNNFKRFVAKVGPVFWLQDRGEEILLWKKGWRVTGTWMGVYAFLCFYPRVVLLLPHAIVMGIILATYPYPASAKHGLAASAPAAEQPTEGSVPWQANIQAIQNLMGAVSDLITAAEPHVHHLVLSPAHFKEPDAHPPPASSRPVSPYTPHILALLAVTFPILAFIVSLPAFPIRQVFLVGGLLPFVATHPWVVRMYPYVAAATPALLIRLEKEQRRLRAFVKKESVEPIPTQRPPIATILQKIIDDDRLTDKCWNSEMREVELWENERLGGEPASPQPGMEQPVSSSQTTGWSKANLRPGERAAWTRGRDGWNGVGGGSLDGQGEVSNLTFSLAPGWAFVETEDWRKDVLGDWSGVGVDEDGWAYTNDAWLGVRPAPYTAGGGSVTRRRRWTRRVWYDKDRAEREGNALK
ncbi:hypothetical protein D9611_011682 [Ephemerocybe angulata]|uniref:TECPR1-like DysF domain-containing protein n=1 Tax=Ephemerocybe angulata TaxID=980116 RepID=A0A8H5C551_9AGAR|nr:hypothetical protein D9611_011682 [Tulosesus angulatus]